MGQTDERQMEREKFSCLVLKSWIKDTQTDDSQTNNTATESSLMKLELGVKHTLLVLLSGLRDAPQTLMISENGPLQLITQLHR